MEESFQMWTNRQNLEWKPRRASIANCQQQQRLINQRCSYNTFYHLNITQSDSKQPSVVDSSQQNDLCTKELVEDLEEISKASQDQQNEVLVRQHLTNVRGTSNLRQQSITDQNPVSVYKQDKSTSDRARKAGRARLSSAPSVSIYGKQKSESRIERDIHADSDCSEIYTRKYALHGTSKDGHRRTICRKSDDMNLQLLDDKSCNDLATCCSDTENELFACGSETDLVETKATTSERMNEKLRIQDKQRKHVILSMALKHMIAEHNATSTTDYVLADQDCCHCSCRSRSCSVSSAKLSTKAALAASALALSRSVFDSLGQQNNTRLGASSANDNPRSLPNEGLNDSNLNASFANISPSPRRRYSGTSDFDYREEKSVFQPRISQFKSQQARGSVDENTETSKPNKMRQIVTNTNSPEFDSNPKINTPQWHDQLNTEDSDLEIRQTNMAIHRHKVHRTERTKRSHSSTSRVFESSKQSELNLEALIIESWLDDHPDFTRDYIIRKATRQVVDDWLVANARVSNTNLSSQVDLRSTQTISRPVSQISLGGYLREPSWKGSGYIGNDLDAYDSQTAPFGSLRANRSNSQSSGAALGSRGLGTPVRKISATDFETRTGSGFLRPMLSKTPDGRLTFLPQANMVECDQGDLLMMKTKARSGPDNHQSKNICDKSDASQKNRLSVMIDIDQSNDLMVDQADISRQAVDQPDESEVKLIFELVKNIYDDLDIRTLLHKILKNIAVLINADRSSLFLVCGGSNEPNRRLVSQLFNVDQDSIEVGEPEESITIPWGTGLVGFVAESGEAVNITDCYKDPRFTDAIDQRTGYITKHMLCAPIFDKCNEIVGVAQVINKRDGNAFSKSDELKFIRYLQFCGIGLRNAQTYEQCQLENRRNQVLLDLARMVFEEQSTIEQVVYRIMLHTQSLLDCERCQVLLIDDGNEELENVHQCSKYQSHDLSARSELDKCSRYQDLLDSHVHEATRSQSVPKLFSLVFDLECDDGNNPVIHSSKDKQGLKSTRAFPINIGITGFVAVTGEKLNIENVYEHERFDKSVDDGSDFKHKSILCMPIRNGQRQIIGVIQLINKKNGQAFNKNDEDLFEAFAIFCGLGIHNTLMYERVLKVMAKQRVTFEVLSYHATAPLEEAIKLSQEQIPSCFALNLASLKFNDFSLDEQFMLKSCLRFFLDLDLMRRFQIDQLVFCNWILSVQKNYRKVTYHPIVGGDGLKASPIRYHNWRHAFNVSQMMFAILVSTQICQTLGELETLALLIACLCHDLDHRGTNNSFQIKSASPLAELYSTSTMEHHHFDQCVMILNSQGNQILSNLSPGEYSRVIMLLEEAILATDLANYFNKRDQFFQLVNGEKFDWHHDQEHRSLLRCMLMTACDVAAITKPWPVQKVVADLVMSEFYQQGDIEKNELKIEPIDLMNRDKMSELPSMQIGFIDSICAPIYTAFAKLFPNELTTLLDGCLANRSLWQEVSNTNDMAQTINSTCGLDETAKQSIPPSNNDDVEYKVNSPDLCWDSTAFGKIVWSGTLTDATNNVLANKTKAKLQSNHLDSSQLKAQRKSV